MEWVSEKALILLSRPSELQDQILGEEDIDGGGLSLLYEAVPEFKEIVQGKRVLDFGCGYGYQSIELHKIHGCSVVGLDTNQDLVEKAASAAESLGMAGGGLVFVREISSDMKRSFDVVISQNSFEHFRNPLETLKEMAALMKDDGKILITFGPPWFAPYGSHMRFFCKVPWVNLLFPENIVMKVRSRYRSDGAMTYEEVESGLNRMTIGRFERIITLTGLRVEYKKYRCVKGMDALSRVPYLRELFINHATVILSRAV